LKINLFLFLFLLIQPVIHFTVKAQNALYGIESFTDFKRELDNFNSSYRSAWDLKQSKFNFGYNTQWANRLFLFNGKPQNVQDEVSAQSWYSHYLKPSLSFTSIANYYSFTNTKVTTLDFKSGLLWKNKTFSLQPSLGWSSDTRSDRTDNGVTGSLDASMQKLKLSDDFVSDFSAGIHFADLVPRSFQNHFIKTQTSYLNPELRLTLNGGYSFNQRDSYQPNSFFNRDVTNIIEKVLSDSTSFGLQLETKLSKALLFTFFANSLINVRNFKNVPLTDETENTLIDTEYARQEFESSAQVAYTGDWMNGQLGSRFSVSGLDAQITKTLNITDEILTRRNEQLRNTFFDQSLLEIFSKHEQRITESQQVTVNTSASILRFDTPETNFDDRDELFLALEVQHTYNNTSQFQTTLLFSGEAYHRVFLFSQRSLENNWRRSLRFQPGMIWLPTESLRITNQLLVRANYTVFDFQNRDGTIRDQSSREWGLSHDIRWEFSKNWFTNLQFSRNQLVIGQLFWNEFAETPIDTLTTTRLETSLEVIQKQSFIKLGIRFFLKDDYIPATILRLGTETSEMPISRFTTGNQQTLQWGPTLNVKWISSKYGEISLDGWLQMQFLRDQWYIEVPDEFKAELIDLTSFRRTRIFPNLFLRTKLYL
jgi:hypothetical protein